MCQPLGQSCGIHFLFYIKGSYVNVFGWDHLILELRNDVPVQDSVLLNGMCLEYGECC